MSYPTVTQTMAARAARLAEAARPVARDVLAALACAGVEAVLVGSAARGDMHERSDLDFLVLSEGGVPALRIVEIAEAAAAGRWPVDIVFADRLNEAARQAMLLDATS